MEPEQSPLTNDNLGPGRAARLASKITLKKVMALLVIAIIVAALVSWAYNRSSIEVQLSNTGNTTVSILDQATNKTTKSQSSESKVSQGVKRGTYEVLVTQGDKHYFAVVNTKGFFGKSTVKADLTDEKSRAFVGKDPGRCTKYIAGKLLSYACGAAFSKLYLHAPAQPGVPGFIDKLNTGSTDGQIRGIIDNPEGEGIIALVWVGFSTDEGKTYNFSNYIYYLNDKLEVTQEVELPSLADSRDYFIKPYLEGFLAYSSTYASVFYYKPPYTEDPQGLKLEQPQAKGLKSASFDAKDGSILTLSSSDSTAQTKQSEVVLTKDGKSRHLSFNKALTVARLCGSNKLCALEGKNMRVYDLTEEKLKLLFSVNDVKAFENSSNGLIVVTEDSVYGLDVEKQAGSVEYSFGDYSFRGLRIEKSGFILSLLDNKNQSVALYLDQTAKNSDSFDKKVASLQKSSDVVSVAAYGTHLFVFPNFGKLSCDQIKDKDCGYSDEVRKRFTKSISNEVSRLGIDNNKTYKVEVIAGLE